MADRIPATYNGSWSIDFDDQEIRADEDGSVLFDVHNGTDEESLIAAAAPQMFNALVTLLRSRADGWDYIDPALEAMWGTIEEAVATAAGQTEATRA